ncbi:MAG: MFS transporter [Actinomycetota bacterium]|nr:MAG: MFS transporter [Actinomycetota bacterium]
MTTTRHTDAPFVLALCGLVLGPLNFSLLTTAMLPLVPQVSEQYGVSVGTANLVLTAALLAGAVATPVLGRLGDLVGKRQMLLVSLASTFVGCALAAATDSFAVLLVARLLQGPGCAAIPLGIAVAADIAPPGRTRFAISFVTVSLSLGASGGLLLGGGITELTGRIQPVFWVLAALALLALLVTFWSVPAAPPMATGRLDVTGSVLLTLGLGGLLLTLSQGGTWGWSAWPTLVSAAVGIGGLAAWILHGFATPDAIVDMPVFFSRQVLAANLGSICLGICQFTLLLSVVVIAQTDPAVAGYGLGLGVFAASLLLLPGVLGQMSGSVLVGRLGRRYRTTALVRVSLIASGIGLLVTSWWNSTVLALIVAGGLCTAIFGFAITAFAVHVVAISDPSQRGITAGMNFICRMTGQAIGTAGTAAVIAIATPAGAVVPPLSAYETALRIVGVVALLSSLLYVSPARATLLRSRS